MGAPSDYTNGDYLQAKDYFDPIINPRENNQSDESVDSVTNVDAPKKYKIKFIDKIANFNPSADTLGIDTDSFGIDSSATFESGKKQEDSQEEACKTRLRFPL